ncbi:MAG: class I SAM-dependent methyltransferase [Thermoplasmatales archaeon]|jgi:demethylmenaquinone methyltransferase/2-methoxy-6-polyprenyl-1,4-benzoquinol methylase|nr:class I SAM-dependent methyltransferase [Candidatus Thermoplasmatota archaeon]MDA8055333.1 class I SAM-dependent methyltransferase [Thermoplasmatales archaeon]
MPEVERVKAVFKEIPSIYDRMNTYMSLGMDIFWRLTLLRLIPKVGTTLDVGTGTGKLESLAGFKGSFIGLDVTREMMALNGNKGKLLLASATEMPIKNDTFDAIVSSFVLRNLPSTPDYFREGFRVLKMGGIMANLDAFPEKRKVVSEFFSLYFYKLLPKIARLVSSSESYSYLALTVKNFKTPETIAEEMRTAGFKEIKIRRFFSPSAAIVYGIK